MTNNKGVPKKKLTNTEKNEFIPGIYNFCDRWCKKCPARKSCLSYAMEKKLEKRVEDVLMGKYKEKNIWSYLKHLFDSTYEILQELAEERGIEMQDIYAAQEVAKGFWTNRSENFIDEDRNEFLMDHSDIPPIYLIYTVLAEKYLEELGEQLEGDISADIVLLNAWDVINWYLEIIHSKLLLALYNRHWNDDDKKREEREEQCNGSAKVALIGIKRSIAAWQRVAKFYPQDQKEISHLVTILQQLQREINRNFPEALTFKRPGFEK